MSPSAIKSSPGFGVAAAGRPLYGPGSRSMRAAPFILFASILSLLSACVPVPRGEGLLDVRFMTTDELRDYSERVFRLHNSITTRLMMAPPADDKLSKSTRLRIEKAESRMYRACTSLNEIAEARASGREVELELENKVRKTVRSCAEATRRLESLLDTHDIGSDLLGSLEPQSRRA